MIFKIFSLRKIYFVNFPPNYVDEEPFLNMSGIKLRFSHLSKYFSPEIFSEDSVFSSSLMVKWLWRILNQRNGFRKSSPRSKRLQLRQQTQHLKLFVHNYKFQESKRFISWNTVLNFGHLKCVYRFILI